MKATAAFMTYGSYLVVVFSDIAENILLSLYLIVSLIRVSFSRMWWAKLKFVLV